MIVPVTGAELHYVTRGSVLTPTWNVTIGSGSLRAPTLLAHGRCDYTVPWTLWEGLVATLPNATLQIFERSGHQPFFEEPDRFAEVLTGWMASTR